MPTLSSDHNPIVFKIHLRPALRTPKPSYDYNHANWPLFIASLDLTLDPNAPFHTTTKLEQTTTNFSQSILQAATQAIPIHPLRCNHLTLPPYLLLLWKIKNHYRRQFQHTCSALTHQPFCADLFHLPYTPQKRQMDFLFKLPPPPVYTFLETYTILLKISDFHSPPSLTKETKSTFPRSRLKS